MKIPGSTIKQRKYIFLSLTVLFWATFSLADNHRLASECGTFSQPGFRPKLANVGLDKAFVANLRTSSITVYPVVFRSNLFTDAYEKDSQKGVGLFFKDIGFDRVELAANPIELNKLKTAGPGQKSVFDAGLVHISKQIKAGPPDSDYICVIEYLHTATQSGGQSIGGIQCYILDANGRNVLSFLLNSHHALFTEAVLRSLSADEDARTAVLERANGATRLALFRQIKSIAESSDRDE